MRKRIYRDDKHHVEPFPDSERSSLSRSRFQNRRRLYRAERDGTVVASAVARIAPKLTDKQGRPYGLIGDFEAERDSAAVRQLLHAAVDWLRERGAGRIVGPIDGDTWHGYRLNLGPHDRRPFLMEPSNPDYYPILWSNAGFEIDRTYHSIRVDSVEAARRELRDRYESVRAEGYRFEPLRLDRLDGELRRIYEMTRDIFRDNYLYIDIDFDRFRSLYDGIDRLAKSRLTWFAVGPDGEDAGYLFAIPDYRRALAAMNGEKSTWAKLKFAASRWTRTANIKTAGVMPVHRRRGLASALAYVAYREMESMGFGRANICLIADGNPSSGLDGGTGELLRRYALYRWNE